MEVSSDNSQPIASRLKDGTLIGIETLSSAKGITEISSNTEHPFDDITKSIESVAHAFKTTLMNVKPRRASIEFGIEIAAEDGRLFAVIVKGEAKANMKITLEWEKEDLGEESISSEAQKAEK